MNSSRKIADQVNKNEAELKNYKKEASNVIIHKPTPDKHVSQDNALESKHSMLASKSESNNEKHTSDSVKLKSQEASNKSSINTYKERTKNGYLITKDFIGRGILTRTERGSILDITPSDDGKSLYMIYNYNESTWFKTAHPKPGKNHFGLYKVTGSAGNQSSTRDLYIDNNHAPNLLSNGFYFRSSETSRSPYILKYDYFHKKNGIESSGTQFVDIHESINIASANILSKDSNNQKIICASKNNHKIYMYEISHKAPHDKSPNESSPSIHLKDKNATTIFESKETIDSICAFPNSNTQTVAIALNNGRIKIGTIKNDKFHEDMEFFTNNRNDQESKRHTNQTKLFGLPNGSLAYYANKMLTICHQDKNKKDNQYSHSYLCPDINKFKLSINGNYLCGTNNTEEVHIMQLSPFKDMVIKLDIPASIAVIDKNDQVHVTSGNQVRNYGHVKDFIKHYHNNTANSSNEENIKNRSCVIL